MGENKTIRITFIISLVGHCLFLGTPALNLKLPSSKQEEKFTVQIEIDKPALLPKIDVLAEEKKLKKEVVEEPSPPMLKPEPELKPKGEEVIVEKPIEEPIEEKIEIIDPAEEAMLRYQDMVKQKIEQVRKYPSWAKRQRIEGAVHLNFVVLPNGLSKDVKIISFSGSRILNQEAVATIQRANPFPPIPPKINQDSVAMEVTIVFALN